MTEPHQVRAFFDAVEIDELKAPYNTASLKVFYPASYSDSPEERNTGVVPATDTGSPFPVVIMMAGINVDASGYGWLARRLAQAGIVTVCYQLVSEEMPGFISVTPGLEIAALTPPRYGKGPSATALSAIISKLKSLNTNGLLAGKLALNTVILGGHSAGGSAALFNAEPDWFEGIAGVFSYGAHSGASTLLGWPEDTLLPLPAKVPNLIMGGTEDGCIANSAARYSQNQNTCDATAKVEQTFAEALTLDGNAPTVGQNALALFSGANHFTLAYPHDETTGRPFIDRPAIGDENALRTMMGTFIETFVLSIANDDVAQKLQSLENTYRANSYLADFQIK